MKYPDTPINNITEFLANFSQHRGQYEGPVWFRGQGVSDWKLEPKLLRNRPGIESHLITRFKQNATLILDTQPKTEFDWLFLMQHYGIATRLLDWSESPLVALYFACMGHNSDPGALWVLLPTKLNLKSNYRPEYEHEIPSFEDAMIQKYTPLEISQESRSKLYPMAAIAPRNSARIQAQQGVFTISHRENIYIEDVGEIGSPRDYIWKYTIPAAGKPTIINELSLLGFNKFQLFPELESLANSP